MKAFIFSEDRLAVRSVSQNQCFSFHVDSNFLISERHCINLTRFSLKRDCAQRYEVYTTFERHKMSSFDNLFLEHLQVDLNIFVQ